MDVITMVIATIWRWKAMGVHRRKALIVAFSVNQRVEILGDHPGLTQRETFQLARNHAREFGFCRAKPISRRLPHATLAERYARYML